MPLETPSFINDFVPTNPISGDPRSEGDDHLRNLKLAIQATLPGMAGRAWRTQTKSGTYTVVGTDNMTVLECTTTLTLNLTAAATLGNGHMFLAQSNGGDGVTLDPSGAELINGAATILVPAGMVGVVYCTGTAFKCFIVPTVVSMSTGDVKASFKTTADVGWVIMNDGSIGSAGSGASTRANADTLSLYTLLWNNVSNTFAPVSGGRGANAAADFAANKTLTLPKTLGRALASAGTGAGLTARALGESLGSENAIVVTHSHGGVTGGQSADHSHSGTTGGESGHVHQETVVGANPGTNNQTEIAATRPAAAGTGGGPYNVIQTDGGDGTGGPVALNTQGSTGHTHGFSTGGASVGHTHAISAEGSSGTGANMPPETFMNFFIKL